MPAVKRRKQSIKFRPKYAGRRAKELSQRVVRTLLMIGVAAGVIGGGIAARRAWTQNDAFKIREVILQGDIPAALETSLPFERTGNFLALRPARVRRDILAAFPELKSLSIHRTWSRAVIITGHYRTPIAWFEQNGKTHFLDGPGVAFELPANAVDSARMPELQWSHDEDRLALLQCLSRWSTRQPSFSSQITKCETDTIHRLQVKLADGTVVDWGEINVNAVDVRTNHVMRVKENYHPTKTPAHLLFVTDDRVVMDQNWGQNVKT